MYLSCRHKKKKKKTYALEIAYNVYKPLLHRAVLVWWVPIYHTVLYELRIFFNLYIYVYTIHTILYIFKNANILIKDINDVYTPHVIKILKEIVKVHFWTNDFIRARLHSLQKCEISLVGTMFNNTLTRFY